MKRILYCATLALASTTMANATSWRINPNPNAKADFQNVAQAMQDDRVQPGDTLLLDAGDHGNANITIENITIIGPGYLLDQNTDWQETQTAKLSSVSLAEGCKIEGVEAIQIQPLGHNCVISRCKAQRIGHDGSTSHISNTTIENCLAGCYIQTGPYGTIRNNIIVKTERSYFILGGGTGSVIENNTLVYDFGQASVTRPGIVATNSTIRNNVVLNTRPGVNPDGIPYSSLDIMDFSSANNNVIVNNVFSIAAEYADTNYSNNYYVGATPEDTFVGEGSDDGKYALLESSAAKNGATHGGDCGAFGGATPYILSGLPKSLPHITHAAVPAKPTDGKIQVQLKIETQND